MILMLSQHISGITLQNESSVTQAVALSQCQRLVWVSLGLDHEMAPDYDSKTPRE